jgi:predicted MPP superfamily phosphohydrolase
MAAAGVELGAFALGGAYTFVEPRWLAVERLTIRLPNWPPALHGLTIAQISDLHYGVFSNTGNTPRAVNAVLALEPDLIVVTGDYVLLSAHHAGPCAAKLARLRAPLGVFTILGNHDHWTDAAIVSRALMDAGLPLLRNEGRLIESNREAFWLAGVDDVWERHADLDKALAGAPKDVPRILLAHEPDYADYVAADGHVSLQLSGHSHGGQVRLPFLGAPVTPYLGIKYPHGLYRIGSLQLYTNRGIGVIAPPVRFNCRPEVTLITLT